MPEAAPAGCDPSPPGADGFLTLQSIILPPGEWDGPAIPDELYLHAEGPAPDLAGGAVAAGPESRVLIDGYFNALSWGKWRTLCRTDGLWLALAGRGTVDLEVWCEAEGAPPARIAAARLDLGPQETALALDPPAEAPPGALVWFSWRAAGPEGAVLTGARYRTRRAAGPLPLMAVCITTFRRPAALAATLARLEGFLSSYPHAAAMRVLVIDNDAAEGAGEGAVRVIANRNLGGAGGFARALIEARAMGAALCLFMDDDALFDPETVARSHAFLALARDPHAALAGAMLSTARPWAMFENGAVFDRTCQPLHWGLDLRPRAHVLALEAASAREARPTLYGGWWHFGFPLAAAAQLPFPFFVRGDDVGFSIANRLRIVTLNGVAVLHEDFGARESPLTAYLDLRSHLVHHLVFPAIDRGALGTALVALRLIGRNLARFHYDSAAAQMLAWTDVMAGPAFFAAGADLAGRRAVLAALTRTEVWTPAPGAAPPPAQTPPAAGARRLWAATVNGHLLPFARRLGRHAVLPLSARGSLGPVWGAARITYVDAGAGRTLTVALSRRRFARAALRAFGLTLRFLWRFAVLRAAWRDGYPAMTAAPFWQALLGLDAQSAAESGTAAQAPDPRAVEASGIAR